MCDNHDTDNKYKLSEEIGSPPSPAPGTHTL